ncbi:MAG: PKD domain-containing protein, partial [Bacteroidia bacterium]
SYNLDSTKWFYNGTDTKQRQDTFRLTSSLGGVLNMKLKGYGKNGCEIVLDTNILITGARLKPRIGQSYGCFPKTFTLIDSFWNDADEFRYWVVDGDSISSDSLITIYTLDGLRDASSNVISIKLVGGTDSCVSSQQYNFAHSGVKFESMYSDSILDCSQSLYTFSISINNADAGLVDLYELVYNGDTLRDYIPKFSKSIELDGSMDTVYLTVLSKRGCRTTQELVFLKNKPALVPLFSSSDASASCPPLQVNFKDESSSKFGSVVSREWFINGQFFSTATNPSRIFSEPGAYTILLKTTDERGCSDSIVVDSFVRINGEQVEIDFGDTLFCSSDTVRCRVIQGDAVKYEWDMGDGTVIEGDEVLYHYSDSGVFPIQVLVSDSSNCKYPVLNPNEIRVYRNPEARFHSDIPCLNESMWVHDSSMYYGNKKSTEWWVDGLYSQNVSSVHHQNSSTDVPIKLKVEDEHGCLDSLVSLQKLYSIQANFQFDQGYICEQDSFTLAEDVVTDTTLESLNYFIDSTPLNVASSGKFVGVMQGTYDLGLIATNQAGCKDSIVKPGILKVAGSYTKSNSDIDFISVGEANEVLVTLIKDTTGIFEYYQVYNANTKIWESGDVNDTTLSLSLMKPYLNSVCRLM